MAVRMVCVDAPNTPLVTTAQAAHLLNVSPAHVRRLAARGALPAEETPLGRLFTRQAVEHRRAHPPRRGRPPKLVWVRLVADMHFSDGSRASAGRVLGYRDRAVAHGLVARGLAQWEQP